MWTARARTGDLRMTDHVRFAKLKLVERYNQPDTAVLEGLTDDLAALLVPGVGAVLFEDNVQRMCGVVTDIQRSGGRTGQVTLTSDLVRLWDRICYPNPGQAFGSQTTDYYVRTGNRETIMVDLVSANAGPGALVARQVNRLRVPVTQARGGTTALRLRFDNLGSTLARVAEQANLRVRVVHTPGAAGTGWLDVVFEDAPDLSAWARYGTPKAGGPGLLSEDWQLGLSAPTLTRAEVAAGGEGAARILSEQSDTTGAEVLWGRRIEQLVDQRQTTDTAEITQAGQDALVEGVAPTTVDAKILNSPGVRIGVDVPVGSVVRATLDGLVVTERVREVTTTVEGSGDGPTVTVEPLFGSADASKAAKSTKELVKVLRRISVIERAK